MSWFCETIQSVYCDKLWPFRKFVHFFQLRSRQFEMMVFLWSCGSFPLLSKIHTCTYIGGSRTGVPDPVWKCFWVCFWKFWLCNTHFFIIVYIHCLQYVFHSLLSLQKHRVGVKGASKQPPDPKDSSATGPHLPHPPHLHPSVDFEIPNSVTVRTCS